MLKKLNISKRLMIKYFSIFSPLLFLFLFQNCGQFNSDTVSSTTEINSESSPTAISMPANIGSSASPKLRIVRGNSTTINNNAFIEWTYDNPLPNTRVDLSVNGADQGPSVDPPKGRSKITSPLTATSKITVTLSLIYFNQSGAVIGSEVADEHIFTVIAPEENIPTPVSGGPDPAMTQDSTAIVKALEYEQAFFDNIDLFENHIDSMYTGVSKKEWYARTYSGLTGVRLYHLYDEMTALSELLRIAHIHRKDHYKRYLEIALRYTRKTANIIIKRDEIKDQPAGGGLFRGEPGQYRYLDMTRGCAWLGYLMSAIIDTTGNQFTDEFSRNAKQIQPLLKPYLARANSKNSAGDYMPAHMASHSAIGEFTLGKISGDMDEEKVTHLMTILVASQVKPWRLTDINHAEQSAAALIYIYKANLRKQSLPGLLGINESLLSNLAEEAVSRFGEDIGYSATKAPHAGEYSMLVKLNQKLSEHIGPKSSYVPITKSNFIETSLDFSALAHLAAGYMMHTSTGETK